jgi:hypothetical protein
VSIVSNHSLEIKNLHFVALSSFLNFFPISNVMSTSANPTSPPPNNRQSRKSEKKTKSCLGTRREQERNESKKIKTATFSRA